MQPTMPLRTKTYLQKHLPEVVSLLLLGVLAVILLAGLVACGGSNRVTGDRAGTVNQVLTVSPAQASLAPGQTLQFAATTPWGGSVAWSVVPAAGGSFSANGLFTASGTQGNYTIVAMWNGDVRYTATATATILPPPPPSVSTPDLVSASGGQQGSANGQIQNLAVVGEPVPAVQAADASGTTQVRHGFKPSGQ